MAKLKPGTICPTCQRKVPHRIVFRRVKPRRVSVVRDLKYRIWCTGEPCAVSGYVAGDWIRDGIGRFAIVDAAHTASTNGMSSKGPDPSCVPLERELHREYDAGRKAFEAKYGVDMAALAKQHYARYQSEKENSNGSTL